MPKNTEFYCYLCDFKCYKKSNYEIHVNTKKHTGRVNGNEMENEIKFNVVVCPFPFSDNVLHGCTITGTSGRSSDTSDNQSGFFTRAATNNLIGNRSANNFNGMWLKAGGIGRGSSYDKVCE